MGIDTNDDRKGKEFLSELKLFLVTRSSRSIATN